MAFILKKPHKKFKGVIIFTHKERYMFESKSWPLLPVFKKLKENYVLGMHWGHYTDNVGNVPFIDFHLAGPGTVNFLPNIKAKIISLSSRNFIEETFKNKNIERRWDIITVARPLRLKNMDQLLKISRGICDLGYVPKVLFVCPCPSKMEKRGWYMEIYQDYLKMFSKEERGSIVLMLLRGDGYPFPLSTDTLSWLYNSSKTMALLSDKEGESRVISEALLCGTTVIAKENLKGGGRDYLDQSNSIVISDLVEAPKILKNFFENYKGPKFDSKKMESELGEKQSAVKLESEIKKIFLNLGLPYEGEIDKKDLSRKLPSHTTLLPKKYRGDFADDLYSYVAAYKFLSELNGQKTGYLQVWHLKTLEIYRWLLQSTESLTHHTRKFLKKWLSNKK
jgi:hypothetical protein